MGGEAFLHVGAAEAEELERQRGIKSRAHHPQPVVERAFGPADCALRALGQLGRDLDRFRLKPIVIDSKGNKPDPLSLLAQDLIAGEKIVFRLGQAAEQGPDDRRVVASGNA